MRVIEISIHPKYIQDCKDGNILFMGGYDFALAIVEIPVEMYMKPTFKTKLAEYAKNI